jgi:ornithine decarboxylase
MKSVIGRYKPAQERLWQYSKENRDRSIYHYQPERLLGNARLWLQKFPGIRPYYAVKCNNHPYILSTLASLGFSFDCASQREIHIAQGFLEEANLGIESPIPPFLTEEFEQLERQKDKGGYGGQVPQSLPDIIFAHPVKMTSHLEYAKRSGIQLTTADCPEELEKIAQYSPGMQVLLRIAVDDSHSICKFNSKFGMPPNEKNLTSFFTFLKKRYAKNLEEGRVSDPHYADYGGFPQVVGVSFHVGSGCLSSNSYKDAIEKSRYVFDFAKKYGIQFKILDIGGGFIQKEPLLTDVSQTISTYLYNYFGWTPGSNDLFIIAEPGRFMASNVFDLYVQIIGKNSGSAHTFTDTSHIKYTINNSVYGAFNCKIFDYATFQFDIYRRVVEKERSALKHHVTPLKENPIVDMQESIALSSENVSDFSHDDFMHLSTDANGLWKIDEENKGGYGGLPQVIPSTIFGATCDSLDVIIEKISIPELEVGDYLCFKNMGAYTYSASSEFNGIPSALVYCDVGSSQF